MRIRILCGATEIGGNCVEIESQGQRIVLDIGLPLDAPNADDFPLPPVKGLTAPDPSLLGLVISHPHQDHYGLAHRLPKETPFLIGKAAQDILAAAEIFSPSGLLLENTIHLENRKPIALGPFKITPFLVDHSAFDAYAILVEADGVGLFYTGDLRAHGRKAKLFEDLLRHPPKPVDILLMEGTTIGRPDTETGFPTEADLERRFVGLFKQTPGMPLIWCSGQNIDRLVTILKACLRAGRTLIIDMYTAHVLRATGNRAIIQAFEKHTRVYLPVFQKARVKRRKAFDISTSFRSRRIYQRQLRAAAANSVIQFRPSMMIDLDAAECTDGAKFIHSMWPGYLKLDQQKPLLNWLDSRGIARDHCHTSGHATVKDLLRLRQTFPNAPVAPIHTDQPERFGKIFGKARRYLNGEWWSLQPAN